MQCTLEPEMIKIYSKYRACTVYDIDNISYDAAYDARRAGRRYSSIRSFSFFNGLEFVYDHERILDESRRLYK